MATFHDITEISDGDDEFGDGSVYNFDEELFVPDNEIENNLGTVSNRIRNETRPTHVRNVFDSYQSCLREILEIFPDISHDHVQHIYNKHTEVIIPDGQQENTVAQALIEKILDSGDYPKEKDRIKELKRKRSDKENDEEEAAKWKYMDLRDDPAEYAKVARTALQEAFEYVPISFIQAKFREHGHFYGAFFAILKAEREYSPATKEPFSRLKSRRVSSGPDSKTLIANLQAAGFDFEALEKEMDSAFQRRKREDGTRKAAMEAERAEAVQDQEYIANGEVMDCGCCCETVTLPKLTHCNGNEPHFFCLECARRNANNDIGNSQYKLKCMDFSDCNATFSTEQRLRFLDEKTIEKLERLQQQEELRAAELDNLSTCPFCDFAAICPPIEEDREFRCHNNQCGEVSCRLCRLKSHIPLTCEEHKKENGISERRVIEEARTEALIRTCNKCKTRILKEDGCNKVICTSCYAALCDYCGKDITKAMYNHFDSESGRALPGLITAPGGKCPLYDESNQRKDQQVEAAEKEAMSKVRADHPELSEEDLRIKFAESVRKSSTRSHHHHVRRHQWPELPPFPHHRDGLGDPPPLFGPRFGPRFADDQANLADAMPGAFPGMTEEQHRQQRHQQQAAYRARAQAQEQQQLQQRLQQAQQQQQIMQQQLEQLQNQRRARLIPRGQDFRNHNQAHYPGYMAEDRGDLYENRPLFGAGGGFDVIRRPENDDPFAFNAEFLGIHQHNHHNPEGRAAEGHTPYQAIEARVAARRAEDAARHAQPRGDRRAVPHQHQPRHRIRPDAINLNVDLPLGNPWV